MQRMAPGVIARAATTFARHGLRRPPPSLISAVSRLRCRTMKFERENASPIDPVSEKQLLRGLGYMHRPTSGSRFAILSSEFGSYVQLGGCGMCCLLEWRDGGPSRHYRASQHPPVAPWPG